MSRKVYLASILTLILAVFQTTCGLPNYFYLGSSYSIRHTPLPDTSDGWKISFVSNDQDQMDKLLPGKAPSLVLFYSITNDSFSDLDSYVYSRFSSRYIPGQKINGVVISTGESMKKSVIDLVNPTSENTKCPGYGLYMFKPGSGFSGAFEPPKYLAVSLDANCSTISVELRYDRANKKFTLVQPGSGESEFELLRSSGESFKNLPSSYSELRRYSDSTGALDSNNQDLQGISETFASGNNLNIKIYAAVYMGAGKVGKMSNIWWTDLKEVGTLLL